MASYRKRGAHAARPVTAPFVALKRVPQKGAGENAPQNGHVGDGSKEGARRVPLTGGNRGSGRKMRGVSGLRTRTSLPKVIAAMLVIGFGAVGFAGGLWSTPSAEPTVQAFLLAWQQHQYQVAAELTTGKPEVVATALQDAYLQLDAAAFFVAMGPISQHGNTAHAAFSASVDLGQDGPPWDYNGSFDLRQTGSGWKVVWSPSVINPGLRPGLRLAVVSSTPRRALLEDANGASLQLPLTAYVAGVRPDRLTHPEVTAARLGRITKLDPTQLLGFILAAPRSSFQELVVLRPAQYNRMASRLARVPGLIIKPEQLRLFSSVAPAVVGSVGTETSSTLRDQGIAYRPGATVGLSGLQRARQRDLAGTPTIKVVTETARGRQVAVLRSWPGQASQPVRTTINSGLQTAADTAMESLPQSAAAVAVQASTRAHPHRGPARRRGHARDPPAGRPLPAGPGVHHRLHRGAARGWPEREHTGPVPQRERRRRAHLHERPAGAGARSAAGLRGGLRARVRDRVQRAVLAQLNGARPDGRGVRGFGPRRAVAAAAAVLPRLHADPQRRRGGGGGHDR